MIVDLVLYRKHTHLMNRCFQKKVWFLDTFLNNSTSIYTMRKDKRSTYFGFDFLSDYFKVNYILLNRSELTQGETMIS